MIRRFFPDGFPPAEPAPSGSWHRALLLAFGLAALVVLLYWPAVDFRLLSFDDQYYTQNDLVLGGLNRENVVRIFTVLPEENLFIPLSQLSYMVDVEVFGNAPRGFHFTNIALHAVDMALLLLVLWRMTGSLWKSVLAAVLVAFHPLRVESVAWVTERKGVLSVLFLLLSFSCYLRYARTHKPWWYGAVFLCSTLGMLAKPMLVTLPILLLILDYWPLGRFRGEPGEEALPTWRRFLSLASEKIPFLVLSALASLATVRLQGVGALHPGVSLVSRLEHSFSSAFVYLYQTVWPSGLVFRYFQTPWEHFSGTLVPATAGLFVVTAIVFRFAGTRPYLAFGWAWYLVSLFPVSGIVPTGIQWISDRFTYIPHFGLAVAFAWTVGAAAERRSRWLLPAVAVALMAPLAMLSRHQMHFWKDGATLFGRGMAGNSTDLTYANQYIEELMRVGDLTRAKGQFERISRFALDPGMGINIQLTHLSVLRRMGDRAGAIAQARAYLREDPRFWKTRLILADELLADGRFAEAAAEYRRVLIVRPIPSYDRGYALEGLGISLAKAGKYDEALASYNEGLEVSPASVSLRYNLARLLAELGETGNALARYEEALRLSPGNVRTRMGLLDLLLKNGAIEAAERHREEIERTLPGSAESILARGRILGAAGMKDQACSLYEDALRAPAALPDTHDAVRRQLAELR